MRQARSRGLAIDRASAERIAAALHAWALELERSILALPKDRQLAARDSVASVTAAAKVLERSIVTATAEARDVAFEATLAAWGSASVKVAASLAPNARMGAVARPEVTTAAAFAATKRDYEWRSLVRGHVHNAASETATLVSGALLRGEHPEAIAKALKPYVQGRDRTPDLFAPELAEMPVGLRSAAYSMDYNAKRIAFSESHNARKEAEVGHFKADPVIALAQWTLSPNRGTQRLPDVCDALAGLDWYGFGAGVFPLHRVPSSPHPFDRCEVLPITRKYAQRGEAKPDGTLKLNPMSVPLPGEGLLSPNAAARIRRELVGLLETGDVSSSAPAAVPPEPPAKPEAPAKPTKPTVDVAALQAKAKAAGIFGVTKKAIAANPEVFSALVDAASAGNVGAMTFLETQFGANTSALRKRLGLGAPAPVAPPAPPVAPPKPKRAPKAAPKPAPPPPVAPEPPKPATAPPSAKAVPSSAAPAADSPALAAALRKLKDILEVEKARAAAVPVPAHVTEVADLTLTASTPAERMAELQGKVTKAVEGAKPTTWTMESRSAQRMGAYGYHMGRGSSFLGGLRSDIHIAPEATRGAKKWVEGDRSVDAFMGTRTMVHEQIHSTSAVVFGPNPRSYKKLYGNLTEEMVVEQRARNFMARQATGGKVSDWRKLSEEHQAFFRQHSYNDYVRAADWVTDTHGELELERMWQLNTAEKRRDYLSHLTLKSMDTKMVALGYTEAERKKLLGRVGARGWELLNPLDRGGSIPIQRMQDAQSRDFFERLLEETIFSKVSKTNKGLRR